MPQVTVTGKSNKSPQQLYDQMVAAGASPSAALTAIKQIPGQKTFSPTLEEPEIPGVNKGDEVIIESSQDARDQTEKDIETLDGMAEDEEEGTKETGETKKTKEENGDTLSDEEREALGLDVYDEQEKQIEDDINKIDDEIDDVNSDLDSWKKDYDALSNKLIKSIQDQYDRRRSKLKDINKRAVESLRAFGMRMGTARYSPLIATGVISAEERAGQSRLADLDAEEARLITEAQMAKSEQDYSMLRDKMTKLENKRAEKMQALEELQELTLERNQEILEERETIETRKRIGDIVAQGTLNPLSIMDALDYEVDPEEITNFLDMLPEPEENDNFLVIGKVAYNKVRDEFGNVTALEPVPGLKTSSGFSSPYILPDTGQLVQENLETGEIDVLYTPPKEDTEEEGVIPPEDIQKIESIVSAIDNEVLPAWQAVPDKYKGKFQGRLSNVLKLEEEVPEIQAFLAASRVVGMQITRLFEKGRISDQDRIFYLNLMPNLKQQEASAKAGAEKLKTLLRNKISTSSTEEDEEDEEGGNDLRNKVIEEGYDYDQMREDGYSDEAIKEAVGL